MPIKMLIVIANALFFSGSLFADCIESPEARAIMEKCLSLNAVPEGLWLYDQNSLFSVVQLAGDGESIKTSVGNEPLLWGLRGLGLTFAPGLVGLVVGNAQGGQLDKRIEQSLSYGTAGALLGAGSSLILSLVASKQELYIGQAFIGDLVGLGTLSLVAVAMYPKIAAMLLAEFVILPVLYFFKIYP